ncbi:MAG: hypothetical protein KIS90_00930 [Phenylobacterium sp.]|nr:hypothetical protein [Phenylobacterium sp.]
MADVANLKRDRELPVTDINYADGVMRYLYLALKVRTGQWASVLDRGA